MLVSALWSLISLSYFISANSQLDATRSYSFNIGLAGVVEIVAYFGSMLTSLHIGRMLVIRRIVVAAAVVHILYFFAPLLGASSLGRFIILVLDVLVRVIVAFGNTFLAIYSI